MSKDGAYALLLVLVGLVLLAARKWRPRATEEPGRRMPAQFRPSSSQPRITEVVFSSLSLRRGYRARTHRQS